MLKDLIARLEAANAPDRALDVAICRALPDRNLLGHAAGLPDEALARTIGGAPPVTERFDAARRLSDWVLTHASDLPGGRATVRLRRRGGSDPLTSEVQGATDGGRPGALARAFCLAALIARMADEAARRRAGDPSATISVPVKLLREAHACMRECGWQLAPAADDGSDGVLQAAVADVEDRFRTLLEGVAG